MDTYMFFFVAFSLILIHEMDAIRLHEWKLFVVLSKLPDEHAYIVFTALHIPIFMIHVGLHVLFLKHPENPFRTWFSWLLIVGAGIAGAIDLIIHI